MTKHSNDKKDELGSGGHLLLLLDSVFDKCERFKQVALCCFANRTVIEDLFRVTGQPYSYFFPETSFIMFPCDLPTPVVVSCAMRDEKKDPHFIFNRIQEVLLGLVAGGHTISMPCHGVWRTVKNIAEGCFKCDSCFDPHYCVRALILDDGSQYLISYGKEEAQELQTTGSIADYVPPDPTRN